MTDPRLQAAAVLRELWCPNPSFWPPSTNLHPPKAYGERLNRWNLCDDATLDLYDGTGLHLDDLLRAVLDSSGPYWSCRGRGQVLERVELIGQVARPCPACNGRGRV